MNQALKRENRAKNMGELVFRVEEGATEVVLLCGEEEVGRVRIEPNRELLEKLLPAIDELLGKHGFSSENISHIRVESELPDGYSSRRITETIAEVWKHFGKF